MRRSPIYDLCLAIQFIPQEFANLQVTREEFLCMKAIILLNTGKRQKNDMFMLTIPKLLTLGCPTFCTVLHTNQALMTIYFRVAQ